MSKILGACGGAAARHLRWGSRSREARIEFVFSRQPVPYAEPVEFWGNLWVWNLRILPALHAWKRTKHGIVAGGGRTLGCAGMNGRGMSYLKGAISPKIDVFCVFFAWFSRDFEMPVLILEYLRHDEQIGEKAPFILNSRECAAGPKGRIKLAWLAGDQSPAYRTDSAPPYRTDSSLAYRRKEKG